MLGSNGKAKKVTAQENALNTIAGGTVIKGEIRTKGDIRIEGTVEGNITCQAKLVIGERGIVRGVIYARNAIVSGKVDGEVFIQELLQLESKASIDGDIYTQKMSVAVGASFSGNCEMGEAAKDKVAKHLQAGNGQASESGFSKNRLSASARSQDPKDNANGQGAAKTAV